MSEDALYLNLARVDQVPPGSLRVFRIKGRRLAVSQVQGEFFAIDDLCTHDEGPLGEGALEGDEVACPRHGARFNVRTGAALSLPAVTPVKVHRVRVVGQNIQVKLSD
jgi:3-phenylpropionate/trans-cinnamate dioxygenase ferredoxin subunit